MEPLFTTGQAAASLYISPAYVRKLTLLSGVDASSRTSGGQRRFTASDIERLRQVLKDKNYVSAGTRSTSAAGGSGYAAMMRVTRRAKFMRRLGFLCEAQLALTTALRALSEDRSYMGAVATGLRKELERGQTLSGAMRMHSDVFTNLEVGMVEVGEESGNLDKQLIKLASYLECERDELEASLPQSA